MRFLLAPLALIPCLVGGLDASLAAEIGNGLPPAIVRPTEPRQDGIALPKTSKLKPLKIDESRWPTPEPLQDGIALPKTSEVKQLKINEIAESRWPHLRSGWNQMPAWPGGPDIDIEKNFGQKVQIAKGGASYDAKKDEKERVQEDSEIKGPKNCDDAFYKLRNIVLSEKSQELGIGMDNLIEWFQKEDSPVTSDVASEVRQSLDSYAEKCLTPELPNYLSAKQLALAVGVVGYGDKGWCTGLRFDKGKVLTARHCFFDDDGNPIDGFNHKNIWFQYDSPSFPQNRYGVRSIEPGTSEPLTLSNDYLILVIDPTPDPVPLLRFGSTNVLPGAPLYLRGYYDLAQTADGNDLKLRATNAKGCVAIVDNKCIFHGCQALQGMSGAPLFLVPKTTPQTGVSEELTVVGIHLQAHNEKVRVENRCDSHSVANTVNVGYGLPPIKPFSQSPVFQGEVK